MSNRFAMVTWKLRLTNVAHGYLQQQYHGGFNFFILQNKKFKIKFRLIDKMIRFGIRYSRHNFKHPFGEMVGDIPIKVEDDVIYLANSDNQTHDSNIKNLQHLIQSLNTMSTTPYSFENVITTLQSNVEKTGHDYGPRENEVSSYLEALTHGKKSWKRKLFVIRDNFLLYFKDDQASKPDGVIPLEGSEITISSEYPLCFEVTSITRRYHLSTTTEDDMNRWIEKLKEASVLTIDTLYEMKETLGKGTFAIVRRGTERKTGKDFAIKIINKESPELRDNIMTEITILKNTTHPNIMKLHHVFESRRKIYLVMELLEGGELFDLIVKRGNLTEAESSKIIRRVVKAILYLHSKNICHRDLKPENLLFGTLGDMESIRVTDFGLSKVSAQHVLKTACGTPSYVAPEILKGDPYGFEVDMWSCGVILYVLLCGFPPFYANNDADLYQLIASGSYSFPSPYWDDISDTAKDLIKRLLVVDPSKRLTPIQMLCHPFITNYKSLSFTRGLPRNLSSYLIEQKKLKKTIGHSPTTRLLQSEVNTLV
jgi:calcium/calmodulin-dependent protein kinase I